MTPAEQTRAWRAIDAAGNRTREGLRVVEDYVRFGLDDVHLTGRLKRLRHELTAVLSRSPDWPRIESRETRSDVGTRLSTPSEATRRELDDVVLANFKRLQESLRSLEEFGKLFDPQVAAQFESLRYQTYTLERAVLLTRHSLDRLAAARLYVLLDGRSSPEAFEKLVAALLSAGAHVLQLRDKTLHDRDLLDRARRLRALTRGGPAQCVINDRADLAALVEADGVHVGQDELRVKDVRGVVGPGALIGVSTHNMEQAREAVLDGADYLGAGPTFPSGTKTFASFPGLAFVRQISAEIRLPTFAIGGVTLENLPQILAAGATRVAVSGAIINAHDPAAAASAFLEKLAPS